MSSSQAPPTLLSGPGYMIQGIKLLTGRGLRRFILIPLIINLIIFILLSYFILQLFGDFNAWIWGYLPEWLSFLAYLLWALLFILFLIVYGYSFTLLTNVIAAPFYGMLASKIEAELTGKPPANEPLQQMIPRTMRREMTKIGYFILYGLVVFFGLMLISWIPLVNIATPFLGILWSSWVMAIQYVDYPADNHQIPFTELRQRLGSQRWASTGLGGCILLGSMIPVINIFVAPVAVAASTLYWIELASGSSQQIS